MRARTKSHWRSVGAGRVAAFLVLAALLTSATGLAGAEGPRRMKLYVTNSEGSTITVIDLATFKASGEIKVGYRVHGLAAEADGRRLFTTVEPERTLKVIDTRSDKVIDTLKLAGRPNQCAVTPNGRFVGVPIRDGASVDIVDVAERKIVKVLPVKVPHNCYNAGSNDNVFVTSMGDHEVNLIDLRSMSYVARIPVPGVPRPIAVSRDEKTLFAALSDLHGFVIVDIPSRRVVDKVVLPPPSRDSPIEPHTPTHGLELTPDGKELWVTSLGDDGVYVYDLASKKLSDKIPTGNVPIWLTFSPDGRYCCVSNAGSDDCSIIDTRTRREVARPKVGKEPKRLVVVSIPEA